MRRMGDTREENGGTGEENVGGFLENNKNCNTRHFLSLVFVISSSISVSVVIVDLPDLNPYCDLFSA